MKITIFFSMYNNNFWRYNVDEYDSTQKKYDYMYNSLDFDKLYKDWYIHFDDKEVGEWFLKTHLNSNYLDEIYNNSPLGYQWLKQNWGKEIFRLYVYYPDKQELKTIVNRIINVKLRLYDLKK